MRHALIVLPWWTCARGSVFLGKSRPSSINYEFFSNDNGQVAQNARRKSARTFLSVVGAESQKGPERAMSVSTDSDITSWPSVYQERLLDCQRISGESRESARSPVPFDPMNSQDKVDTMGSISTSSVHARHARPCRVSAVVHTLKALVLGQAKSASVQRALVLSRLSCGRGESSLRKITE